MNDVGFYRGVAGFIVLILVMAGYPASGNGHQGILAKASAHRTYIIEIKGMAFNPAEITARKGDKITFMNHDLVTHDITEASKKAWTSSPLAVNKSWSMTVTQSATYYCTIHPVMRGKISVK